jgi:hypothetical protein
MIGIGIGAATLEPATGDSPDASTFSIGAGIWFAVTGIIAALLGGFAAGHVAGQPKESSASCAWPDDLGLTTLVVFWLLRTTIGGLIGGTFSTLTNAIGNAAGGAGAIADQRVPIRSPQSNRRSRVSAAASNLRPASRPKPKQPFRRSRRWPRSPILPRTWSRRRPCSGPGACSSAPSQDGSAAASAPSPRR